MYIDLASGLFLYVVVSVVFGQNFDWLNLPVAIFFAFFPDDLDVPIFMAIRKIFKLASHRFFHHPLIVMPLAFAAGYWWQGYYGAFLCFVPNAAHFFHDSFNPTGKKAGIKWLSPFVWDLFYIENWKICRIPYEEWKNYLKGIAKGVKKRSMKDEVMSRMEPMGPITLKYLAFSLLILFMFFVQGR